MGINEFIKIGSRIKELRISKGISQKDMAAQLGINRSTYSNYENDIREPNMQIIEDICKVLGCSFVDLLGRQEVLTRITEGMQHLKEVSKQIGIVTMGISNVPKEEVLKGYNAELLQEILKNIKIDNIDITSIDLVEKIVNSEDFKVMIEHLLFKFSKEGDN